MRLTVGPHPAAVYWRRRAVVLVGIAMVILVVVYACTGPDPGTGTSANPTPARTSTGGTVATTDAAANATSSSGTSSPSPSAFTLPVPGATGPCTDNEMQVSATAGAADVPRDTSVTFTIAIKNISTRACNRDIGADMQELRLMYDKVIVWSSDDCGANTGHDDRAFEPGQEVSFTINWNGRVSRGGDGAVVCDSTLAPQVGVYQLIARLDQLFSGGFSLRIES
jgi:hypothetical protein